MSNLQIITGHYGSGKTEFCINYALRKSNEEIKVAVVDLDIVNPYFRSREQRELLEKHNIDVVGSSTGRDNLAADLPALPAEINKYLESPELFTILDVGGDGAGARVLSRYSHKIILREYDMYMVVNANRPFTADIEGVTDYISDIEGQSRLKITGLINNTHMLRETTAEDIFKGAELCEAVGEEAGIPVVFNVIPNYLKNDAFHSKIKNVFILDELYMRPNWL